MVQPGDLGFHFGEGHEQYGNLPDSLNAIDKSLRYIETLADLGLQESCQRLPGLAAGINVDRGQLICRAVAIAHGLESSASNP
jgi:alanine dehydrogenase